MDRAETLQQMKSRPQKKVVDISWREGRKNISCEEGLLLLLLLLPLLLLPLLPLLLLCNIADGIVSYSITSGEK